MIYVIVLIVMGMVNQANADSTIIYDYGRIIKEQSDVLPFDPALRPFYHGVASGDPLSDRVILWTRITPDVDGPVQVSWVIAKDPSCTQIVNSGTVTTSQEKDYTVKIDAIGLEANAYYYYRLSAEPKLLPIQA